MGIRESLKQSKESGELNLKDFVMPEDEKNEGGFDFEKEIGEEDFKIMKSTLDFFGDRLDNRQWLFNYI